MSQALTVYTVATPLVPPGPFNWVHIHNASASTIYLSYDGTTITAATGVPLVAGARIRFDNANKPYIFVKGISAIVSSGTAGVIVAYSAAFDAPAVVAPTVPYDPVTDYSRDDFDSYTIAVDLAGLNGGLFWLATYVSRSVFVVTEDSFDSYTIGVDLGALNAGTKWDAAYVSRTSFAYALDSFDSYTIGADLDSLNSGTNWNGAYVSR
jgi:hypothetical protein